MVELPPRNRHSAHKMSADASNSFPWLDELNPQQRQAVTHGDGPLLIVAGAGSGKTRTLAYRVAYLIATGVDPEKILLLTFTRRAAEEMLKRAEGIVSRGTSVSGRIWGGTFHATANRLLRIYANLAGISPDFTVMDEPDAEDMIDVLRQELNLASRDRRFPRKSTCFSIYSRCVNGAEDLKPVLARDFPWCGNWEAELKELFKRYVAMKQEQNVLDYDDLLLYWLEMLADDGIADRVGGKFDHVLVDEYQDTNLIQAGILQRMRRTVRNVTVVGDDAQSIYSFRAASVRNMLDFPKQFPGATLVTLDQNYRSVPPILETTNRVIAPAKERYTKDLWSERKDGQKPKIVTCKDEAQQDQYIVERVIEHYEQGIKLKKMAILFRATHHSDSLELLLPRRNIPYHKYGGLRFLEAAHVKDLIAFLRIAENPRDQLAWFRVLQLLDGIGPASAAQAVKHVAARNHDPLSIRGFSAPPAASDGIAKLGDLLADVAGGSALPPAAQVERIRKFYEPIFKKVYENAKVRIHDIENLERVATGYRSRRSFLTDLALDPPQSTSDLAGPPVKDEDWLNLSTIHSAKGCEWDVVIVIHASDGCLPADMSTGTPEEIEEERRLLYVAMTRARDFLYVTWPLRYYSRWHAFTDHHMYAQRSRFLTDGVCQSCDMVSLAGGTPEDQAATGPAQTDVRARVRAKWG